MALYASVCSCATLLAPATMETGSGMGSSKGLNDANAGCACLPYQQSWRVGVRARMVSGPVAVAERDTDWPVCDWRTTLQLGCTGTVGEN